MSRVVSVGEVKVKPHEDVVKEATKDEDIRFG